MSWIGAGIGALFGARGGVLTSIAGAVIGNWVEEKLKSGVREAAGAAPRNQSAQGEYVLLAAIAAMLAKLAKADGRVTADEVAYCESVFGRLGLTGEKREYCIRVFRQAKDDATSIYDYAASFASAQPAQNIREIVYDILWDLACADGMVTSAEQDVLARIVRPLRINAGLFAWQYQRRGLGGAGASDPGPQQADPYEVLGCPRTASDEVLKKAYREKAKSLHPDVLRAQGISEELLSKANEQMARLNAAWSEIRKARGL